ncbi:MAG TPA: hypothetical protein VFD51_01825 [Patescibacteria group bacterium]|nr:hypothetical protein [Patescibacteria group bacterium]
MSAFKNTKINLKEKKEKKSKSKDKEIVIMRVAVFIIALAIIILWVTNQKNVWRNNNSNDVDLSNDIKKIFQEPEPGFEEGKEILTDDNVGKRLEQDAGKLLEDIMNEANKKATSTELINCPEWINCMPTIGEARPCTVLPGCEGITKIAY